MIDRKSSTRFEMHSNPSPILLSRESSLSSSPLTCESSRNRNNTSGSGDTVLTESSASRKIGRFELTTGNNSGGSTESLHPYDTTKSSSSATSTLSSQLDELIRFNETQKTMLQELSFALLKNKDNQVNNNYNYYTKETEDR